MNATRRPSAEIDGVRGRSVAQTASSRQCGGSGLPRRSGVGTPPYSSVPTHSDSAFTRPSRLRLDALERGEHEPADRREIVATLLHDHGRQPERAEQLTRRAGTPPR